MSVSGGHLLVQCLKALGVTRCFGVPGESYLDVLDGLYDASADMTYTICRNEGGAAFMAEAYGKLTGYPGICLVTRGPGATNASIGVHTAMQNSSPMILMVGQVADRVRGREAFQEIDYHAFFGAISKLVIQIDTVDRIPEIMARAWSTALSGRPGPVVLSLPESTLEAQTTAAPCLSMVIPEPAPTETDIEKIAALLESAYKPLLLVGGGRWKRAGILALEQLANQYQIPVVTAFRFNDLIDNHAPVFIGEAGVGMLPNVRSALREADLILAIGVRLGEMTTDDYTLLESPSPSRPLIHAHPSDMELGKIFTPAVPVHAGPNELCSALLKRPLGVQPWRNWLSKNRDEFAKATALPPQPSTLDMSAIVRYLQQRLPEDAIVTNGAGNFTRWPNKYLKYGTEQRLLAPQSGAMGYGLPAAITARLVFPERLVVCFVGDGDLQMNCQELGTAMQTNALPVILVINNGTYGTIRMHQEHRFPGRTSGTDLQNPDFCTLARAYGMFAEEVHETHQFAELFELAIESPSGALLDLHIPHS